MMKTPSHVPDTLMKQIMIFRPSFPFRALIVAGCVFHPFLLARADTSGSGMAPPADIQPPGISSKPPDGTPIPPHDWQGLTDEQREARRKAMRERWEHMSPSEREALREKMKEHWEKMTPEERDARRKAVRERWDNMSAEEREQFRRVMDGQSGHDPDPDR